MLENLTEARKVSVKVTRTMRLEDEVVLARERTV